MKFLVILALTGLIISNVVAITEVCPPKPSMSVLNTITEDLDCDICSQIKIDDSDFYTKCGTLLSEMILDKLVDDCNRILETGKKAQIQWFWDDLNLACKAKSGLGSAYVKFDPPTCDCDPCVELAKASSEFMQLCAPELTECEICEILCKCRQVKNDYEQLWLFYQDLKEQCFDLTAENITVPLCDCDVCWLLFYETSDFMQKCGSNMDPIIRNKLLSSCESVMCDPLELANFKMNLELICERKLNLTFDFPQCACEECWLLFQTDSDFMKTCGYLMSDAMLMELMETCYDNMDTLDNFMKFLDDLESVCYTKVNGYFKKEWCHCLDCLLLEDPTQPIWEKCVKDLSDEEKKQNREDCLDAMENEDDFEQFKEDFVDSCPADGVTFPSCDCTRQDLCLVFVIDSSGSISLGQFGLELDFIRTVIQAFGDNIGPDKSQIGLIQFSTNANLELSLCEEADQDIANDALDYILNHKMDAGTHISKGILHMIDDVDACCTGDEKQKYAIVLTDGYAPEAETTAAVNSTPADVTLIAIGFGGVNSNTLNIIARNIQDNVYKVDAVEDLSTLVDDLKSEIGC